MKKGYLVYKELGELTKDALRAVVQDMLYANGLSKQDALAAFKHQLSLTNILDADVN